MANINGLGLGLTGKTFSMIPNKLRVNQSYFQSKKIVNTKLDYSNKQNNIDNNNTQIINDNAENKAKVLLDIIPPESVSNTNIINKQDSTLKSDGKHQDSTLKSDGNHQDSTLTSDSNHQDIGINTQTKLENTQKSNDINSFQQQCINNLYSNFSFLKLRLSKYQYFNNSFICYIDYTSMKKLIDWSRQNNISENMMTLKTLVNYNGMDLFELGAQSEILKLVSTLENLGPTQHAIIVLKKTHLKQLLKLGCGQSFWPSDNNGITWISSS